MVLDGQTHWSATVIRALSIMARYLKHGTTIIKIITAEATGDRTVPNIITPTVPF